MEWTRTNVHCTRLGRSRPEMNGMPRYFFDIHDGADMIDHVGTDCDDLVYRLRLMVQALD